jgi:hypothetical protein
MPISSSGFWLIAEDATKRGEFHHLDKITRIERALLRIEHLQEYLEKIALR